MSVLPANLPNIAKAKLPATYEGARASLEKCVRLDECREWANKADALASYAKQAEDDELQKMAERIRARAIRRCGELLRAIKPARGGGGDTTRGIAPPSDGRSAAARGAGMSRDQKRDALRVARIPEAEFEAAVESDDPPTVTRMLEERKAKPLMDLGGRDPHEFSLATQAQGQLRRFAEFTEQAKPAVIVRGAFPREHKAMLQNAKTIAKWLDNLITRLQEA